jgi:hypothetical protein
VQGGFYPPSEVLNNKDLIKRGEYVRPEYEEMT